MDTDKILVIAAHPDDEILGCGGTIKRLINEGNKAYSLILSDGVTSRSDEECKSDFMNKSNFISKRHEESLRALEVIGFKEKLFHYFPDNKFDSIPLLNIIKIIEKYINEINPDIIFTHHYSDLNIDHRRTFQAVLTATRPVVSCNVKKIYCFETLSSTEWNFSSNDNFNPNYFVNIETTLNDKTEAMKCYKSELREFPHPRSIKALEVSAQRWGSVVGCSCVEAFQLIREIV